MFKVSDENFKSIVYISHPYGGLAVNKDKIADIIDGLIKQHPDYLFVSPVHAFGYAYNLVPYKIGISYCLWLLEKCDEMWVFGDWKNSKGCNIEVEYCEKNGIPYYIDKTPDYTNRQDNNIK